MLGEELAARFYRWQDSVGMSDSPAETARMLLTIALDSIPSEGAIPAAMHAAWNQTRRDAHAMVAQAFGEIQEQFKAAAGGSR